jgi:hypothetical protein
MNRDIIKTIKQFISIVMSKIFNNPKKTQEELLEDYHTLERTYFNNAFIRMEMIPYDSLWDDETDYLSHPPKVKFKPGEIFSTTIDNRDIIFIGTRWGLVVIYHCYLDNQVSLVKNYSSNEDRRLRYLINQENQYINLTDLIFILGKGEDKFAFKHGDYENMNIGEKLEYLFS